MQTVMALEVVSESCQVAECGDVMACVPARAPEGARFVWVWVAGVMGRGRWAAAACFLENVTRSSIKKLRDPHLI